MRIVLVDGREIPAECVYAGLRDGIHEWVVTHRMPVQPSSILVGTMPGRTSIRVAWIAG